MAIWYNVINATDNFKLHSQIKINWIITIMTGGYLGEKSVKYSSIFKEIINHSTIIVFSFKRIVCDFFAMRFFINHIAKRILH